MLTASLSQSKNSSVRDRRSTSVTWQRLFAAPSSAACCCELRLPSALTVVLWKDEAHRLCGAVVISANILC
ncbi:hypothetical protein OJAV_G00035800 [Oryzias javanicus]|uniref:Uncharacterized protein n=1 Tax=Oryzias javanicus TaxID=123683 RepID=A0A3S2MEE1_ORYJA|nr:hypothetical protein OJAV_G00035800 [Oryzias javanicus]